MRNALALAWERYAANPTAEELERYRAAVREFWSRVDAETPA